MSAYEYYIIKISIDPTGADQVHGIFHDWGCLGSEEIEEGSIITIKGYFDIKIDHKKLINQLENLFPQAENIQSSQIKLGANEFKPQPFDPICLVNDYWIIPPEDMQEDLNLPPNKEYLIIRPGMAFGTGRHETTQLAAKHLATLTNQTSLLDVGTGSGVLAILGAKLGFEKISTVEIDTSAHPNCFENFELNHLPALTIEQNIEQINDHFEVVVANIVAPTLIFLAPQLMKKTKSEGYLILSGILEDEFTQILQTFQSFEMIDHFQKNEWLSVLLKNNKLD